METIFTVSFVILCAVLSQGMVLATEDIFESSSDLHIRQKRMDLPIPAPPGSSLFHKLPPFLAYDLHLVHIDAPAVVTITRRGESFATGYAIHLYLILVDRAYISEEHPYGVSIPINSGSTHVTLRVESNHISPNGKFAVIELKDPIYLDGARHGALADQKYQGYATEWAASMAKEWIPRKLLSLRPLLMQDLLKLHLENPTIVHVRSSNKKNPGKAYAIHPYIVLTRPKFVGKDCHVISGVLGTNDEQQHRIIKARPYKELGVVLLELMDPILLGNGVDGALTHDRYSIDAIHWASFKADKWMTKMLAQANYNQRNKEP